MKIITWIWQSGGIASRGTPILKPEDATGMKIRGGSREMDMMFKAAGAATSNMPSNEIYISLQTGAIDAACTSSSSLISFKLEELSKGLMSAGGRSFFFVFEPILMSKSDLRQSAAGPAEDHPGGRRIDRTVRPRAPKPTTSALSEAYAKAGVAVKEMDQASRDHGAIWRATAPGRILRSARPTPRGS